MLATGGLGQIFLRTTNPVGSRGDGLAMAYRAGARVINTEYVQFHPTAFYHRNAPCFLITEAVRGAGARLVDERGTPFMDRYDPEWKDLAPRDVVARSIHSEILKRGVSNVYLDLRSYIPAERIRAEFPGMYAGLPRVRHRHHARPAAGGAGRALLLRRRVGGRARPQHDRPPVRGRRGVLHRAARRQPAREHLAARGPGVGPPLGAAHRGASSARTTGCASTTSRPGSPPAARCPTRR